MHPRLRSTVLRLADLTLSLAVAVGLIALRPNATACLPF